MATDTTTPSGSLDRDSSAQTDTFFNAEAEDSVFDSVQLAQVDGGAAEGAAPAATPGAPQQVAIPAGTNVVRVPV